MQNDFNTDKTGNPTSEELAEDLDRPEISDLPLDAYRRSKESKQADIKQRLLHTLRNVSRATFRDITQVDEDVQALESARQADDDEFELEISELPPNRRSHHLLLQLTSLFATFPGLKRVHTPAASLISWRRRRRDLGRAFVVVGMCLMLLLLLIGNLPDLRTRLVGFLEATPVLTPTQSTRFTFSSMPIIVHHFGTVSPTYPQSSPGPLPSTCPQISSLQYFTTPLDPPGLGASTVWLSGFTGPSAALDQLLPINAQVAHASWPGGWYETVAVFIQKGSIGNITLRGTSQAGSVPVWLSKNNPQILGTSLTLNLDDGSHYLSDGQWEMTSVIIAVPGADCYTLQASWSNNSWVRYFAAGT